MGRKKTAKKGDWKPIRVRPAWLDKLRAALKKAPDPPFDIDKASDPTVLHFACDIAAWVASGEFLAKLEPAAAATRLDVATRVAAHFGGTVVTNADGSLTVIDPGQQHASTVPAPVPIQQPLSKASYC